MTKSALAKFLSRWVPAVIYAAFIWWLSSQSALGVLPPGVNDKMAHGLLFGLFALLLWRAASGRFVGNPSGRSVLLVVGVSAAYAAVDEFHQSFVPGRDASAFDALADVSGAALVLAVVWGISAIAGSGRKRSGERRSVGEAPADGGPFLTLLSRRDCHLCDLAEEVLQQVQTEIPFRYEKVDVAGDEGLTRAYGEEVPVVLLEGRKIFKYKVDPERLRKRLRRALEGAD